MLVFQTGGHDYLAQVRLAGYRIGFGRLYLKLLHIEGPALKRDTPFVIRVDDMVDRRKPEPSTKCHIISRRTRAGGYLMAGLSLADIGWVHP